MTDDIKLPTITCRNCGYTWIPRRAKNRRCPNCETKYFDRERPAPKWKRQRMIKPAMEKIPDLDHPFPLTEMNTARCMAMELKWYHT